MSAVETLPNPVARNLCWRVIQIVLQFFFSVWIGVRSRGIENLPAGGALLLINHQSMLDPLLVGLWLKRPVSFLGRENLFDIPVIGWILRNTYVMSIRREAAGTESMRKSIARLQHGFYVGLFPEGTRTTDGQLGTLKPGFIAIARRGGTPIVPVGISGGFQALPRGSYFLRPVKVRVVFGEPIPIERVNQLCEKGREQEFVQVVTDRIEECFQLAETWRTGS